METSGKKVVIIGGASGMGRATAELLAGRGAQVAVLDREGAGGGIAKRTLTKSGPP